MLLNNYWHFKNYVDTHNMKNEGDITVTVPNVKNTDGTNTTVRCNVSGSSGNTWLSIDYSIKQNLSCTITSDTTTINPAYYEAPNRLNDDDTKVAGYKTTYSTNVRNNNKNVTTFTIQGINIDTSSFTITQIGIYKKIEFSNKKILLALEELPDPITVPAGEGFTIIYEWTEQ